MNRFIIEHSDEEFYTSTSGISLVGLSLNRFTDLAASIGKAAPCPTAFLVALPLSFPRQGVYSCHHMVPH